MLLVRRWLSSGTSLPELKCGAHTCTLSCHFQDLFVRDPEILSIPHKPSRGKAYAKAKSSVRSCGSLILMSEFWWSTVLSLSLWIRTNNWHAAATTDWQARIYSHLVARSKLMELNGWWSRMNKGSHKLWGRCGSKLGLEREETGHIAKVQGRQQENMTSLQNQISPLRVYDDHRHFAPLGIGI
jgi:hypothetical protein